MELTIPCRKGMNWGIMFAPTVEHDAITKFIQLIKIQGGVVLDESPAPFEDGSQMLALFSDTPYRAVRISARAVAPQHKFVIVRLYLGGQHGN